MICDLAIKKWRAIQKGDLESTIGILRHFNQQKLDSSNKYWT
jgi:hypothetical protein